MVFYFSTTTHSTKASSVFLGIYFFLYKPPDTMHNPQICGHVNFHSNTYNGFLLQILVCSHIMGNQGNTNTLAQNHPRDSASFTSKVMGFSLDSGTPPELVFTAHLIIAKCSLPLTAVPWVFLPAMACPVCRRLAHLVIAGSPYC